MVQGGRLSHNPLLNNAAISLSVRRKCHPGKFWNDFSLFEKDDIKTLYSRGGHGWASLLVYLKEGT